MDGEGYSDIFIKVEDDDLGIVIEIKYAENAQYEMTCQAALEQIQRMDYGKELLDDGCHTVLKYGIACYKKKCRVAMEKEEK